MRRRPATVVVWRWGALLSVLLVHGRASAAGPEAALALARTQQGRIVTPTPIAPGENDARLVPLDDPALGVPVYWLGDPFDLPGALPAIAVADVFAPIGRHAGLRTVLRALERRPAA